MESFSFFSFDIAEAVRLSSCIAIADLLALLDSLVRSRGFTFLPFIRRSVDSVAVLIVLYLLNILS